MTIPGNTKQCRVTNYYVVQILCVNSGGSPFRSPSHRHGHRTMDQTTSFDSTGFEHQHWIKAALGIIETLTLDPMTGIFYPFISSLLHTKTGQHSLPPLPMVSCIGPREYGSPTSMRHHNPFPLFHWPALNLPNTTKHCQVALCLLMNYTIWTLPCHINLW